jgi:putative membrane protein
MLKLFWVGLVALEHLYFLYLEMFLWTTPKGLKTFRMTPEKAEASKVLAANQGLYNGFLAAGLVFGTLYPDALAGRHIQLFFLACVVVAGCYGAATVGKRLFLIQAVPALIAFAVVLLF